MKKIVLIALLFCGVQSLFAQKLTANKVPQAAKDGFKKTHPTATATWEREDNNYEANFTENGKRMSCVVDKQGMILETESPLIIAELPAAAKTYVNQHYKGKKPKEVAKIVKASGETEYEVNYGNGDVLFNANGSRIEKGKKKED